MYYDVIIEKIIEWKNYNGVGDEYRKTHDRDCILTNGNLYADTIFSLWLPLRYTLEFVNCDKWNEWKKKDVRKQDIDFFDDLIENINTYLPEEKIEKLHLDKLFHFGMKRANVMILPYRQWNTQRGNFPYYEYMPHFLYDKLNTENIDFLNVVKKWILDEHLDMFFNDGNIDKESIIDLAGTGSVTSHKPEAINLEVLFKNYIDILEKRSKYYM